MTDLEDHRENKHHLQLTTHLKHVFKFTKMCSLIKESAKVEILPEARGEVDRHVLMPFLKTVVLADVMQVVPSDDDGPLHLHLGHHTWKRVTTNKFTYTVYQWPALGLRDISNTMIMHISTVMPVP